MRSALQPIRYKSVSPGIILWTIATITAWTGCADSAQNTLTDVTPATTCEANGKSYQVGEDVPAADGCNSCVCSADGNLVDCTLAQCPQECTPDDCGPKPQAPNYLCDDGITTAGPGACELQENGQCGWTMVQCPDTCTPGESFESGCNTCYCPESGKKNEAACTLMDCGCTTDADCQDDTAEAYCSGTEVISPPVHYCDETTGQCATAYLDPGFFDCADLGQICEGGQCIDDNSCTPGNTFASDCNTCTCPSSGNKADADDCTEWSCECTSDDDCLAYSQSAYCDGSTAVPGVYLMCDTEKNACVSNKVLPLGPVNCASLGQICYSGECIYEVGPACIPGETFTGDDGCNTCVCPSSGVAEEAVCTEMACQDCYSDEDCGSGALCVVLSKQCATDSDCDGEKTAAYCDGNLISPGSKSVCEKQTGMCVNLPNAPIIDCAATGLVCEDAACVTKDTCSSNLDCGEGATPPYCDGDNAVESSYPACDTESGQCITAGGGVTDCAALGLICDFGDCVAP
jgi:hypothetical protein